MGKLAQARAAIGASTAAYTLVDLSSLDKEDRKAIEEDALAGGGLYGIRVVEESVNGGARAPLFGVYKDGPEAERWEKAKKEYGIKGSKSDDAEVRQGAGLLVDDPRREAALREAAAQRAEAEAAAIRAGEEAEIGAIVGDEAEAGVDRRAAMEPTANIVDATLSRNATNEAADAGPSEDADKDGNTQDEDDHGKHKDATRTTRRSRNPR